MMGKVRVYVETPNGTGLAYESVIPVGARARTLTGEDALIEGAFTNEGQVGVAEANADDVAILVGPPTADELNEEAVAEAEAANEAAEKDAEEAAEAAKEAAKEAKKKA